MNRIIKIVLDSKGLVLFFGVFAYWLFFKGKTSGNSSNSKVNDAINILDNAFNRYGTLEVDVFSVFNDLTKEEIIRLYKDFGIRRYNSFSGLYTQLFKIENVITDLNLRGILEQELKGSEHEKLKLIHTKKGLNYPYLG